MTWTEAMELKGSPPVLCSDGSFGMVIVWDSDTEQLGIQIPGEDDIRMIPVAELVDKGNGALLQRS